MRNGSLLRLELAFSALNRAEWAVWVALTGHAAAKTAAAGVVRRRRRDVRLAEHRRPQTSAAAAGDGSASGVRGGAT